MTDNKLIKGAPAAESTPGSTVQVGQWYWVRDSDGDRWFGCAVHIGSNYVQVAAPCHDGCSSGARIHNDDFWDVCEHEPNPDAVIGSRIEQYQAEVATLMGRVQEVTARLGVAPSPSLGAGDETSALALRNHGDGDMRSYEADLVKAKTDVLPDLFRKIGDANDNLATWMSAKVLPLQAQANGLKSAIDTIKDRIFSVQLYAGLVEQVKRISDGDPAPLTTPIHVMQRRCYMDEECLAHYESGGMDFASLGEFDHWLTKAKNRDRLLPFERCIVAFQVRRCRKERLVADLSDFVRVMGEEAADSMTYLYLRNGERVYRMHTEIEFGEGLFPDMERSDLGEGRVWARMFASSVKSLVSHNEYLGILEDHERQTKAAEAFEDSLRTPEAKARAKAQGKRHPDRTCTDVPWAYSPMHLDEYEPFDRSSVHYDDIAAKVASDIKEHNRIALILQGLLDRSEVFHPHPPWQIWSNDGFEAALRLVYDKSRTLAPGAKPDFEAYRKRLNESLKPGCVTVGQHDAWLRHEAEKKCDQLDNDWRDRGNWRPERYAPPGNEGPGLLAKTTKGSGSEGKCSYAWLRERISTDGEPIRTTFTTDASEVLNVSAYKPGDFHKFFDDPRTRADYLQWAPLLLAAEDYHAGTREAAEVPFPKRTRPTAQGKQRYQQRKLRKQMLGQRVKLTKRIETVSGEGYEPGTLWRVVDGEGWSFTIERIEPDAEHGPRVKGVTTGYFHSIEEDTP
jgi:hypothetical protein